MGCVLLRLCRDPRAARAGPDGSIWWFPRPGRDGVGGLAVSGLMARGSEEAGGISHQTRGFLLCRFGSCRRCHPGLGAPGPAPQGWGLQRRAWRLALVPPSVPLSALPRNVKWHFCSTVVAAAAWGASPSTSSPLLVSWLSEHPAPVRCGGPVQITGKVGDVSPWLLPPAVGSQAAPGRQSPGGDAAVCAACAVVGQLLCTGVLGEWRHAPGLGTGSADGHVC